MNVPCTLANCVNVHKSVRGNVQNHYDQVMSTRSRPPGMVEVAALAGVSYQTVSRVVNDHPSVAPETRRRVQSAIEQLGFRPNHSARALVTGRGSTIAVFASNTTLYGFARTLEGIEQAARQSALTAMITVLDQNAPDEVARAVNAALAHPLAGVIALSNDEIGRVALDLVPTSVPSVGVGGPSSPARGRVMLDEHSSGKAATQHLLDLGHRTVHHIAIPGKSRRGMGWREALQEAGSEIPEVLGASWLPRTGYEVGRRLGSRADVTAVFAGNDDLAVGLIRGLFDSGRLVPDDVSVIGFDGQPFTEFLRPALTTVNQNFVELGRTAVALLQDRLADPTGRQLDMIIATELVLRESTAPPPGSR